MPATFKPELKATPRQDGTRAIRIRITKDRKHSYYNLGKYIAKSQWNKAAKPNLKNWVQKHDDADLYNNAIKNAITGLETVADKLPAATAAEIKEAYENALSPKPKAPEAKPLTFFDFADEYVARLKDRTFHTGANAGYEVREFKNLIGEHTPYNELFTAKSLHTYLQALKDKKNAPSTIGNKIDTIRRIYNAGVKAKALPDIGHPFDEIKITAPKKKKVRPNAGQVRALLAYEPKNEIQAIGKTVGMLQYLLQGARIGEALTLEWANVHDNYVEYLPGKGATKPKFIPRSKMLNQLLEAMPKGGRYVLPYIGEDYHGLNGKKKNYRKGRITTQVNKGLKEIAAALEIDIQLSSHMFRHAFADAVIATGSNIQMAAALLGHSTIKTTEVYLKDLQLEDISEVSNSIFDSLTGETPGKQ